MNKWKKERKGRENGGKGEEGRERVIFLCFYVTQGLSKLVCIPESTKTRLPHSFYDLPGAIVVFHSAELQRPNLDTCISIDLNNTVYWNYLINFNSPFVEK